MHVLLMNQSHIGPDHYRVKEPARAVQEAGLGVAVTVERGLATTMRPVVEGGEPEVVDVDVEGADVVVLQARKTKEMLQCIRVLQARGSPWSWSSTTCSPPSPSATWGTRAWSAAGGRRSLAAWRQALDNRARSMRRGVLAQA